MNFSLITFGQYIPEKSIIHSLDPRAKLFSILFLVSSVFPIKDPKILGLCIFTLLIIIKISKIPFISVLKSAKPVFFLVIFTFLFNLIALSFSNDFFSTLSQASFTSLRLLILMLFAVMLPLTTSPLELSDGIGELLRPLERFGFPANDVSMMLGMSLRFIPLLMQETDKIMKAQLSRGARLDQGNIFKRIKAFFPVLIPLFIIIFRRADETAIALEARGYNNGIGRTRRNPLKWKLNDTVAVIISFVLALIFFKS